MKGKRKKSLRDEKIKSGSFQTHRNSSSVCIDGYHLKGTQTDIKSFFTPFKRPRTSQSAGHHPETPASKVAYEQHVVSPLERDVSSERSTATRGDAANELNILTPSPAKETKNKPTHSKTSLQQMYLDLGQRDFAKQTICRICGMLFVHGLSEDSKEHAKICYDIVHGVPFQMTNARIICTHDKQVGSFVAEIRPSDSYELRRKVKRVLSIVDEDLGFVSSNTSEPERTAYLFVRGKRVMGIAMAEVISHAYVLQSTSERSNEPQKAMVGIHKIWVHQKARKQGIASMLVDAVRSNLVYGLTVPPSMVAFSSPSEAGTRFAQSYIRDASEKEISQLLVYDCL